MFTVLMIDCTGNAIESPIQAKMSTESYRDIEKRGILRVGTMESAFSYYDENLEKLYGYDLELVRDLADSLNLQLELVVTSSELELENALSDKRIDLIAYPLTINSNRSNAFRFLDNLGSEEYVLVEPYSKKHITSIDSLLGKKISLVEGSYAHRYFQDMSLQMKDTLNYVLNSNKTQESLVVDVAKGNISYAIVSRKVANYMSQSVSNCRMKLPIGEKQHTAWAVRLGEEELAIKINNYFSSINIIFWQKRYKNICKSSVYRERFDLSSVKKISKYDSLFKKYAKHIEWDWRLLAALSFNESHFNPYAKSYVGAQGMMQMMPQTYRHYGLDSVSIHLPEPSIKAGVKYLEYLNRLYRNIQDKDERVKFILASYNCGPGHVLDAMRLAKTEGCNPHIWFNSVDQYLEKLSQPEYYSKKEVRCGRFRANHTIRYINDVYNTFIEYCTLS